MAEIPVSALELRLQKLVEKARAALERGSPEYALEACAEVLKMAPECVAVRRLQRVAQLKRFRGRNRFVAKAIGGLSALPFLIGERKREWEAAEKWVAADPMNGAALTALGEAALARGWPETAVFAFEAARELQPENANNLVALGEAWLAAGRAGEALACADEVLAMQPAHAAAQELMRRASIAQTVADGKWEEPTTFREKLK